MADTASPAPPDPAVPPPPTVLLVDDEPSVLSALRRLFRTQGYRIEQATGGADALALMRNTPVDLVVSDMRMPGMDGAAFLAQVRTLYPMAARILLTGYADITSTIAAINDGAIHRYISKPWDDNDLLLVVGDALQRRGLELENSRLLALTQSQNQALTTLNLVLEARVAERTWRRPMPRWKRISCWPSPCSRACWSCARAAWPAMPGAWASWPAAWAPAWGWTRPRSARCSWPRCCTTSARSASTTAC